MKFQFASALDTGRVRKNNEDSVAVDTETGVAVLADGMGGYLAGEVASGMATSIVSQELVRWYRRQIAAPDEGGLRAAMDASVEHANRAIYESSVSNPRYSGMGTTLVMFAPLGDGALFGHVGDSRAYLWRQGRLRQITKDHSFLQEQLDAGLITAEQAARSHHRNLVTRALGVEADVILDIQACELVEGDLVLMCSDGLTDMLDDQDLSQRLANGKSLQDLCEDLVAAANEAGGRDNISVVLVRVQGLHADSGRSWWPFGR